ncbi:MAG: RlmE family RNA methyltransferase [Pseudomonadota bacterium]
MSKNKPNKHWLNEHRSDVYVKKSKDEHYRSRAVYKLKEIDQKDKLIKQGSIVVDLGAAPGGWSQYAVERVGQSGRVFAFDILEMESIMHVNFIHGDFTEEEAELRLLNEIDQNKVDLVISDMAPNLTGIRMTDQARSIALCELVAEFCGKALKPGGDLLIKVFEGAGTQQFRQQLQEQFVRVLTRKPDASRDKSREFYVLARSYGL